MLRAISWICLESQVLDICHKNRRDISILFRGGIRVASLSSHVRQTVTSPDVSSNQASTPPPPADTSPPPPSPIPPDSSRAWTLAAAVALTASLGGVYWLRKRTDNNNNNKETQQQQNEQYGHKPRPDAVPDDGSQFPERVEFLVAGAGTAAFAAMRALRSRRPDARVLLVGDEFALPYMRPPLSKELWREPLLELSQHATVPDDLTFAQFNGRRRSLSYEPESFYTPVARLGEDGGGVGVARGWRVSRLDVLGRRATLSAVGRECVTVQYDHCLIATGSSAARVDALSDVARTGRSLTVRSAADVARLADLLQTRPGTDVRVAVVGGGLLGTELSAALASNLSTRVWLLSRGAAPLGSRLPAHLAADVRRRLQRLTVTTLDNAAVVGASLVNDLVRLELSTGADLDVDVVVECVGAIPNVELARDSGLELDSERGGVLVNAELQARAGVWAAGDVASLFSSRRGRVRPQHHEHAVRSGRAAGDNMAADRPREYELHDVFWSDLGPDLAYEAIGEIDSKLPTVSVFASDAVSHVERSERSQHSDQLERSYSRGVVFYMRGSRVVGVLLWNLFNRMQVARQVLQQGEFDDLFEVAKLFALHEDE